MKTRFVRAILIAGCCAVSAAAIAVSKLGADAETSQAEAERLNLYNEDYVTITSAAYPADQDYFAKPKAITLGRGETKAEYPNVLQLLVKGPFEESDLGTYYSALTYDISAYSYNRFCVVVGNANCDMNNETGEINYTNEILYRVMADGKEIARSTHSLASFETEYISCAISAGTRELRLHAQSEIGAAYGECNWANPTLYSAAAEEAEKDSLTEMTASGTDTQFELYHIGAATLAEGTENAVTDENAIIGAIHGDYGNNTYKFSADYDVSSKNYTRFTADVGLLFGSRVEGNAVWFKVVGFNAEGAVYELDRSAAMDGLTYRHFDLALPAGTTKIQLWAQSAKNTKAWGNVAICNAKLYTGKLPVRLLGEVVCVKDSLTWGDELPELKGNFVAGKASVAGKVILNEEQSVKFGEHEYTYTFVPADEFSFGSAQGTVRLTAGKKTLDISGVSFEDESFDYDGTEKRLLLKGAEKLPEFVRVEYSDNTLTAPGSTEAIVSFTITGENADLYNEIPSLTATLTVRQSEAISSADARKEYTKGSATDVTFTLRYRAVNAQMTLAGTPCPIGAYEFGEKNVVLKNSYLETLETGEHQFEIVCEGGKFTLIVNVKAAENDRENGENSENGAEKETKKSGCSSSVGAVGVLTALLFGTVIALKKQKRD